MSQQISNGVVEELLKKITQLNLENAILKNAINEKQRLEQTLKDRFPTECEEIMQNQNSQQANK